MSSASNGPFVHTIQPRLITLDLSAPALQPQALRRLEAHLASHRATQVLRLPHPWLRQKSSTVASLALPKQQRALCEVLVWVAVSSLGRKNAYRVAQRVAAEINRIAFWTSLKTSIVSHTSTAGATQTETDAHIEMVDLTSSEADVEEVPRYDAEAKLRSAFQTPSVLNRSAYLGSGASRAEVLQGSAASIKRRKLEENGHYAGVLNHTAVVSTVNAPPPPKLELPEVFNCTWRKPQHKKHKTWDGDGWLLVHRHIPKVILKCQDTGTM